MCYILEFFKTFLCKSLILADKVEWNLMPFKSKGVTESLWKFLLMVTSSIKALCPSQRTCPRLDQVAMQLDLDEVWNCSTCQANYPQPVAGCLWRLCFGWMLVGLLRTGSTRLTDTLLLLSYFQSIFKRNGRCCSEFVQIHGSGVSAICSLSQLCFLVWTQPKAGVEKQTQLQSLGVGMYCHLFKTGSKIEVTISKDISEEGDLGTSLKAWEKGHE